MDPDEAANNELQKMDPDEAANNELQKMDPEEVAIMSCKKWIQMR